jgi:hypothetical protein
VNAILLMHWFFSLIGTLACSRGNITSYVRMIKICVNLTFQGKRNPCTDQEAVKSFLGLVKHAREMKIDRYCLKHRVHWQSFFA